MTPKQFRPIILKTLKESGGKYPSIAAFADALVEKMEAWQEMAELMLVEIPEEPTMLPPPQGKQEERRILLPSESERIDISERIVPGSATTGELKEYFTKQEIYDYLNDKLPAEIEVSPVGFDAPVKLFKRIQKAPGDLAFVKIVYIPAGANSGIELQVATTDREIDALEIISSIQKQAMSVLSPTQRTVAPRITPRESLMPDMGDRSFGAQTDERTSPADMEAWNRK